MEVLRTYGIRVTALQEKKWNGTGQIINLKNYFRTMSLFIIN